MGLEPRFPGFFDELVKIAVVPSAVKQYRRSLGLLHGPGVSFHGVVPKDVPVVDRVRGILRTGGIEPRIGAHGPGAHIWNGKPRLTFMNTPESVGFALPTPKPGTFRQPPDPRPADPMRRSMTVWQHLSDDVAAPTTPLPLPAQSSLVAPRKMLHDLRGMEASPAQPGGILQKRRYRTIDSSIFNRAEADLKANQVKATTGYGEYATRPSRKELQRLAAGKSQAPRFKKLRGSAEDDLMEFAEAYPTLTRKKP